jgi:hypothetical protein
MRNYFRSCCARHLPSSTTHHTLFSASSACCMPSEGQIHRRMEVGRHRRLEVGHHRRLGPDPPHAFWGWGQRLGMGTSLAGVTCCVVRDLLCGGLCAVDSCMKQCGWCGWGMGRRRLVLEGAEVCAPEARFSGCLYMRVGTGPWAGYPLL